MEPSRLPDSNRGILDEEKLRRGRLRWPELAKQEKAAADRLQAIIASGDPSLIAEGSTCMADWIDARCAMIVYAELEPEWIH